MDKILIELAEIRLDLAKLYNLAASEGFYRAAHDIDLAHDLCAVIANRLKAEVRGEKYEATTSP